VIVVDALRADAIKTSTAAAMLKRLGVERTAVLIDVAPDDNLKRSVRNLPGVTFVASRQVTARDVANAGRVVATKHALETLQDVLA
jgi:large subunit ribosomal protein L4